MIEKSISLGCGKPQQIAENMELVTLPKIWLRNKEIEKVDQIEMPLTEGGDLLLIPAVGGEVM